MTVLIMNSERYRRGVSQPGLEEEKERILRKMSHLTACTMVAHATDNPGTTVDCHPSNDSQFN